MTCERSNRINEADRRTDERAEFLKRALEAEQRRHGEAMRQLTQRLEQLEEGRVNE